MSTFILYRCLTLAAAFTALSTTAAAQQATATTQQTPAASLPKSGEILEQGKKLYDAGHYRDALALYREVSPSDTNFSLVLHELSMTAYQDSDFVAAMEYAEEGLKRFPEDAPEWYMLRAEAEDDKGNKDSAAADYDRVLTANPYSYQGWFNKGVCLYRQDHIPEARVCFQRCLMIYPYQTSAHYFLGLISLKEGDLVPAMLSFMTALIMNPEGRYTKKIVGLMTAIASVNDQVSSIVAAHPSGSGQPDGQSGDPADQFDAEQEILLSKAALDKQYPLHSEVEDPITRQMQALLEKAEYRPEDKGFWMQYYVPFYKDVFGSGNFDAMVHQMFGGLGIKAVDEWNRKHKSEHDGFVHQAFGYFKKINETELLPYAARDTAGVKYLFEDEALSGKGSWREGDKEKILTGPWEFYYKNGRLKSKGLLDDNTKKQGEWAFYYRNGVMEEKSTFKDGDRVGKSWSWFDNGVLSETDQYTDGELDGEIKTWYYNGVPHLILPFDKGKRSGAGREFSSDGYLTEITNYADNKAEGGDTLYFPDGRVSGILHYVKGSLDGDLQKFNDDGTLIEQGSYTGGKKTGPWKTFFASGHVRETYTCVGGLIDGDYTEYYDNGAVAEHFIYEKGHPEGKASTYTEGGRLSSESVYERGKVRELRFYGQDGRLFPSSSIRGGAGDLVFYDSLGNRQSEGVFTKLGDKEGRMSYYFVSGALSGYAIYKDDQRDGPLVNYFHNGRVSDSTNYTDGNENGYYAFYYQNGRLRQEGWYTNGDRTGPYAEYDDLGNATYRAYYNGNDRNGYSTAYAPNGRKNYEYFFRNGWVSHLTQWDTAGRVIYDRDLLPEDTVFLMKRMNGKDDAKAGYAHLHNHGAFRYYHFDGSLNTLKFYRDGLQDSLFKQYYYGGKVMKDGFYHMGDRDGVWTEYYEDGRPRFVQHFHDDKLNGVSVFYNEDGTKTKETTYKDDEAEGPEIHYGDNNQLSYVLYFHQGDAVGYSYEGKDGHLVPLIPLPGRSGLVTAWYPNGQKSAEFRMVENVVEGQRTLYFSNGKTDFSVVAENGEYMGPVLNYYPDGKIKSQENEYYDNFHGLCKYYYPSGVLRLEAYYYNGDAEGQWKYYDEAGHLKQTRIYYYGDLQAVY